MDNLSPEDKMRIKKQKDEEFLKLYKSVLGGYYEDLTKITKDEWEVIRAFKLDNNKSYIVQYDNINFANKLIAAYIISPSNRGKRHVTYNATEIKNFYFNAEFYIHDTILIIDYHGGTYDSGNMLDLINNTIIDRVIGTIRDGLSAIVLLGKNNTALVEALKKDMEVIDTRKSNKSVARISKFSKKG